MDTMQSGSSSSVGTVVYSYGGPVCNSVQPPAADLCVSGEESCSVGDRCLFVQVVRSSGVCIYSSPLSGQSHQEDQGGSSPYDPHRSQVALSTAVHTSPRALACPSSTASSEAGPSRPAEIRDLTKQPRISQFARLAVVRELLRSSGASHAVKRLVCCSRRPSTEVVYGHKWDRLAQWCSSIVVQPTAPSVTDLTNF